MNNDAAPTPAQLTPPVVESSAPALQRLYTVGQVVLATVLGSPMAGAHLMARNARELGHPSAGRKVALVGLAATVALFAVSYFLPARFGGRIVEFVALLGMRQYVIQEQGEAIATHRQRGGTFRSWWAAAGIGFAYLALILAAVTVLVVATTG